jgi:FG-GAP-like repeat
MKKFLSYVMAAASLLAAAGLNVSASDPTRLMDFDGDGKTDVAVFDSAPIEFPIRSTYFRYISSLTGKTVEVEWGITLDSPAAADYDGDGFCDPAINRWVDINDPNIGMNSWWIKGSTAGAYVVNFGPIYYELDRVPGDYEGTGHAKIAYTHPNCDRGDPEDPTDDACQTLYTFPDDNGESYITQLIGYSDYYGSVGGGIPAPGDYEGEGKSNIAIYNKQEQKFKIFAPPYTQASMTDSLIREVSLDIDYPTPGDFNGDGRTDFAGVKNFLNTMSDEPMIWKIKYNPRVGYQATYEVEFGNSYEYPVPGDYDGDGRTDLAVYNRGTGVWTIKQSSDNVVITRTLGDPNDMPTTFPVQNIHFFNPLVYSRMAR